MGTATMRVSRWFLREMLNLPMTCEVSPDWIEFTVSSPDIPEGVSRVNPSFRKQAPVVFEGWNPMGEDR